MNFIKKTIALSYLMCLLVWTTMAQSSIVAAEYFIDEEPGIGNATSLSITIAGSVDFDFSLNVEALDLGIHALYLRTKQDNGLWSVPYVRYFFVIDPAAKVYEPLDLNLVNAEYFIDTDPGTGEGTSIAINDPKSANQDFSVTLGEQSAGLHYLYLRTLQDDGVWSVVKTVPFFVIDEENQELIVFHTDIVAAEYFFDVDPGTGQGINLPLQKGDSLDNRPWAASTAGLSLGMHKLNIRTQSQDGLWNIIKTQEVFIYENECEQLPLADFAFDTVSVDTPINLADLTTEVSETATYAWDLSGDGVIESTARDYNPQFSDKGVYPLKLTVTNTDGCSTSMVKDLYITDGFPTEIELSANDSLFVGETLTLTAPAGFEYEWNTGETTSSIEVTEKGEYFAWLTSDDIYYKSEIVTVQFFKILEATLKYAHPTDGQANGSALFSQIDAGVLPYTITWSTGDTDLLSINDLAAGSYSAQINTAMGSYDYAFDLASISQPTEGIIAAEYFFSTDPGPGHATSLNVSQNTDIQYQWAPSIDGLLPGLNEVYIRVKQASGLWGFATKKHFYVLESEQASPILFGGDIVYAEYAIDDFPDLGSGTVIELTSTGEMIEETLSIDASGLETGAHQINIRVKDESGNWSFETPYVFNICESIPDAPTITDLSICESSMAQAIATGDAATFVWYDSDQVELKSSTDNFLDLSNLTDTTTYGVAQYDEESCLSDIAVFNVNVAAPEVYGGTDLEVLSTDESFVLEGMHPGTGGSWSGGTYVTEEGVFDPMEAGGGSYELTYSYDTLSCTATDTRLVTVSKVSQTISVTNFPSEITYDQLPYTFQATASSELAVDLRVASDDLSATALTLNASALGEYSLQFGQSGDGTYLAEETDFYSLTIAIGTVDIVVAEQTVTYTGNEIPAIVETTPDNLNYTITYDGASAVPSEVGNYEVVITIDEELYEGSLAFTYSIVNPRPDFLLSSLALTEDVIEVTDPLVFSGEITNDGSLDLSEDLIISYYLSTDEVLDSEDVVLGSETITDGLAIDASITIGSSMSLDESTAVGDYHLLIVLDEQQLISELDEDNNLFTLAFEVFVNQNPTIEDQTFSFDENETIVTIGTVVAEDPEEKALTFSISSGNDEGLFQIDASTGVLSLIAADSFDFETVTSFPLIIAVSDGELSSTATVTLEINNVNEAPVIEAQSFSLIEGIENETIIGSITSTDPEEDALSYSITNGDTDRIFDINFSNGALRVVQSELLDFETAASIILTVSVSDGEFSQSALVTLTLNKLNEAPSVVDQSFSIDEHSAANTIIGSVQASDPEGSEITYEITAGNSDNHFALNSSGELSVGSEASLDFETTASYILDIEVSDGELSSSAQITISINDVNDAPSIEVQSFTIDENSSANSFVGTVQASDVDSDELTFEITAGDTGSNFSINDSGILLVGSDPLLDFESTPSIILEITVSDGESSTAAEISIALSDVNEAPSIEDQAFSVDENSSAGIVIGSIQSTDPENKALAFEITAGNIDNAFTLDDTSGELTISTSESIDFETLSIYQLTVEVSDGELSQNASVVVNISDVNEAPSIADQVFSIDENSAAGTVIGSVQSNDPENDALVLEITDGDDNNAFVIDSSTGEITVNTNESIDFETQSSYQLTVQVSDGALIETATVTINVNDLEEKSILEIGNEELQLQLYPNPVSTQLHIDFPANTIGTVYKIINMSGSMVQTGAITTKEMILSINLESGVYYLFIDHSSFNELQKFIVK